MATETEIPFIKFEVYETEKLPKHLFMKFCTKQIKSSYLEKPYTLNPMAIIAEEEEKEILALKDPSTESYKRLNTFFSFVATELNVNILVFLGHIDVCTDQMRWYDFNTLRQKNSLPTFVFIIGCKSQKQANIYNNHQSIAKLGYMFFGFDSMVHVYNGDIYLCPNPMIDTPSLECRYDATLAEKEILSKDKNEYEKLFNNSASKEHEIMKCCEARREQYTHAYIEAFNTRKCVKLTAEKVVTKLLTLAKDDGSLYTYDEYMRDVYDKYDPFTITLRDGIHCSSDARCTPVPKNSSNVATYNKLTRPAIVIQEIFKLYTKLRDSPTPNVLHETDELMRSYINSLSKEQQTYVLNYKIKIKVPHKLDFYSSLPIFFIPFEIKLPFLTKDLLTKYSSQVEWKTRNSYKTNTLLHHLLIHREKYTAKEMYRLFLQIHSITPDLFLEPDSYEEMPFVSMFQALPYSLPLLRFYLKYFPSIPAESYMSDKTTTLLRSFFDALLPTDFPSKHTETYLSLLENLLIYGADPNILPQGSEESIVEYYENREPHGFIDARVIRLLYIYGFADPKDLRNKRISKYSKLVDPNSKEHEDYLKELTKQKDKYYEQLLSSYRAYNSNEERVNQQEELLETKVTKLQLEIENLSKFSQNIFLAFSSIPEKEDLEGLQKSKEVAAAEIDVALAQYEGGHRAIPALKQLYTNIQKYTRSKKLQVSAENKNAFLKTAAELYAPKANENEGNSALRRYNLLSNAFEKFKKDGGVKKPVAVNAWGGGRKKTRRRSSKPRRHTRKH